MEFTMQFFTNFKWALPLAFSDAVSLCRFEEGDTLYDTTKAYKGEWGEAKKYINYSLQVRFPAKATSGKIDKGGSVFAKSWNSEVRIDLYKNLQRVGVSQIHTTQGRLYTLLWKGDLDALEKPENPPIPLNVKVVTKQLGEVENTILENANEFPIFVMVLDKSNQISKEKYLKIHAKLKKHLLHKPKLLTPRKVGFNNWDVISPTINIAVFRFKDIDRQQLEKLIKDAVYKPTKDAKKDMYRLNSHGRILER